MIRAFSCFVVMAVAATAGTAVAGPTASAKIVDSAGKSIGTATFSGKSAGVEVNVKVSGLPPGKHGIHLHENGRCEPPGFATAGSHFNPSGKHHGAANPQGRHAGDLPNLEVKPDGTAELTAVAQGATLDKGKTSFLKSGGTALIIHAQADDEKSDPTGNSGARIACGVVTAN